MMHQQLHDFDKFFAALVQKIPDWIAPLMSLSSFLGLPAVIVTVSLLLATFSLVKGHKNIAVSFILAIAALGGNSLLKLFFHRARPETLYAESILIKSYSFPSGHAFGSAVFYGLLAYLCYRHLGRSYNIAAVALFGLLIFSVGISRVYLGAHFPSDVLVGWLLGIVSLYFVVKICKL